MPAIILIAFVRGLIAAIAGMRNRARTTKPKSMCIECAFAHIQYGACGRRSISCTYGGVVRPVALDVLYCTDYRPRYAPARSAIGFVNVETIQGGQIASALEIRKAASA